MVFVYFLTYNATFHLLPFESKNVHLENVEISTFNIFTFSHVSKKSCETSVKHLKIHENGVIF